MEKPKKYLIIGHGLAGSILAWTLRKLGHGVVLVGSSKKFGSSSRASQGLISPISGLRFSKTYGVERCFPAAERFYREVSQVFGKDVFHRQTMTRVFRSTTVRDTFLGRLDRGYYGNLVDRVNLPGSLGKSIQDEYGSMVFTGAKVDVSTMLTEMHREFEQEAVLHREPFQYQELRCESSDHVSWRDQVFSAVVFCEGVGVRANPWFHWIPIAPIKGQILTIRENRALKSDMRTLFGDSRTNSLQKSCWIVPAGGSSDCWKVGATYEREFEGLEPDDRGTEQLLDKLRDTSPDWSELEVVNQIAGARPCSEDKKPILGAHPVNQKFYCFNGFGSKGCLWIPFWAGRLAGILGNPAERLDSEVDIKRYFKIHDSTHADSP